MADEGLSSFNPANMIWQGNIGYDNGVDKSMVCRFYMRALHNAAKSKQEGRPVYEDKIFVIIHPPGERLNIVDREATDFDKRRWPAQWHQFQQNKVQQPDGTPIDLLYPDYPSVAAMLRAHGVATIEQCAALSGNAVDNMGMGSQRYVNAAKTYIQASAKGVQATQLRAQLEDRDREVRVLERKIEALTAEVENLRAQGNQGLSLAQIQQMLAGAMARPQHLPAASFDPQSAMINATSATAQITQAVQNDRRKRARAKLGG